MNLDPGADLIRSVLEACRLQKIRSGEVRASGWLEDAELIAYDPLGKRVRPARKLASPLHLVHFHGTLAEQEGNLTLQAHVVVVRDTDAGYQTMGGMIGSAKVLRVEVVVETFEDLIIRRAIDSQTNLPGWSSLVEIPPAAAPTSAAAAPASAQAVPTAVLTPEPSRPTAAEINADKERKRKEAERLAEQDARRMAMRDGGIALTKAPAAAPPKSVSQIAASAPTLKAVAPAPPLQEDLEDEEDSDETLSGVDWDTVRAASQAQEASDAERRAPPRRGDLVDHHTFGRCVVDRMEESQERISLRVQRNARLVQVSLEYLTLEYVGKEGQGRLFRALPKPRRDAAR